MKQEGREDFLKRLERVLKRFHGEVLQGLKVSNHISCLESVAQSKAERGRRSS